MNKNKSNKCLNCQVELNDSNYCPNCGQRAKERIISLKQILHDFFGEYFTFDSKFFRSLFPLLFKPGRLTTEYVGGRRVSYILPLRLYLFTTFIFFFILAVSAKYDSGTSVMQIESQSILSGDSLISIMNDTGDVVSEDAQSIIIANYDSTIAHKSINNKENQGWEFQFTGSDSTSYIGKYLIEKAEYLTNMGSRGNQLFKKELINQVPKVLFILLPIFALILKLLYIRRNRLYIEHLIFSLHFHTFVFIVLLLPLLISHWLAFIFAFLAINVYLYFSLSNYYQDTYSKAAMKMCFLVMLYLVAIIPTFALLILFAVVII